MLEHIVVDKSSGTYTLSGDLECLSFTVESTNLGIVDFNDQDITIVNDWIFDGEGDIYLGNGTLVVGGNIDWDQWSGTWQRESSTVRMIGNDVDLRAAYFGDPSSFENLEISGLVHVRAGTNTYAFGNFIIYENAVFDLAEKYFVQYGSADISGTISGASQYYFYGSKSDGEYFNLGPNGKVENVSFYYRCANYDGDLGTGTYSPNRFYFWSAVNDTAIRTGVLLSGNYVFENEVRWKVDGDYDVAIDLSVNNPNITFKGDVSTDYAAGNGGLKWIKGNGTIDFLGANDQSINFDNQSLENIEVDKSAGTVTQVENFICDSYYITYDNGGIWDVNDYDFTAESININGNGDFNAGTGNIICNGDFRVSNILSFTREESILQLNGSNNSLTTATSLDINYLVVNGNYISDSGSKFYLGSLGGLTINSGASLNLDSASLICYGTIIISGALTGVKDLQMYTTAGHNITVAPTSNCSPNRVYFRPDGNTGVIFNPSTFSPTNYFVIYNSYDEDRTGVLQNGSYIFDSNVYWLVTKSGDFIWDCSTNNPNIEFRGNLFRIPIVGSGDTVWRKGTGTVTFAGSSDVAVGFEGADFENLKIDKGGGTITFDYSDLTCDSFTVESANNGNIDFNGYNITSQGIATIEGSGRIYWGTGTHTFYNDFITSGYADTIEWSYQDSTIYFMGSGNTINTGPESQKFNHVNFSGDYNILGPLSSFSTYGDVNVALGATLNIKTDWNAYNNLNLYGSITGEADLKLRLNSGEALVLGDFSYISPDWIWYYLATSTIYSGTIGEGTYSPNYLAFVNSSTNTGIAILSGDYIFDCEVRWRPEDITDLFIDNSIHNPNFTFKGNIVEDYYSTGVLNWSKGTGTVTFAGLSDQNINFGNQPLEDVIINKGASAQWILDNDFSCQNFVGSSGIIVPSGRTITIDHDCDWESTLSFGTAIDTMNGCTWNIGNVFTTEGQVLRATKTWYLQAGIAALAYGTGEVSHSHATGYSTVNATSSSWSDNGSNENWAFSVSSIEAIRKILLEFDGVKVTPTIKASWIIPSRRETWELIYRNKDWSL